MRARMFIAGVILARAIDASAQVPAIVPLAECVQPDPHHAGQVLAQFGYASSVADDHVDAPYGASNFVTIDGVNVGPAVGAPASLSFGVHTNVFSVRASSGAAVVWNLYDPATNEVQTASPVANTPTCIPAGAPGPAGANGAVGPKGPDGQAGPQGLEGSRGPQGIDGIQGTPGPVGLQGEVGAVGQQGPQGLAGQDGQDGRDGQAGSAGPRGVDGSPGIDGEPGAAGLQGPQGLPGMIGPQGAQGPLGPEGLQGRHGNPGADGPRGVRGERGARGPLGPVGPVGEQGDQGNVGRDGPHGPVGPQGPIGEVPAGTVIYLFTGDPVPAGFAFVMQFSATLQNNGGNVTLRMYRKL